jgi:hypothetical protein
MARKDDILQSFLGHDILKNKYQLDLSKLPDTVREALKSPIPIVKSIALIVEGLESQPAITDKALHLQITQYLNDAAI